MIPWGWWQKGAQYITDKQRENKFCWTHKIFDLQFLLDLSVFRTQNSVEQKCFLAAYLPDIRLLDFNTTTKKS